MLIHIKNLTEMKSMKIVFIDSNIWIYAHVETEDKDKREDTISFLKKEIIESRIISSVQVLNEFHWTLKKKYRADEEIIARKIKSIIKITGIVPISLQTYQLAFTLRDKYNLSFWDSLIVSSAVENEAKILYSEDMHNGLSVNKKLKIINPLKRTD